MGLIETIKQTFSAEPRIYEYDCSFCDARFESRKADISTVTCPECNSTDVRSVRDLAEKKVKQV